MGAPSLYTITPGTPFVDALAAGVTARVGRDAPGDPLALARVTILLPTRRAVRSLREAFLRVSEGAPILLPRMMPLGDLDEDELLMTAEAASGSAPGGDAAAELPPVIGGMRRQLLLARMILQLDDKLWHDADPGQAAELAAELARFLDQMETERIGFEALERLTPVDAALAAHWETVLAFLRILTEHWPAVLEEEGAIGPAERRNRLLAAQAKAWTATPPDGWVIAAGSTGSIPATADLLAAVARLPKGCVVLPGFDRRMPDEDWNDLPETHAQFGLSRLLKHVGATRAGVRDWHLDWPAGADAAVGNGNDSRANLLSLAMSPGQVPVPDDESLDAALDGLTWLESPAPADEAATIALMMRGTLETPGRTAALVTPDRGLARRVAARLRRWGVAVDDSAGVPLSGTASVTFLRALAEAVATDFAPVPLLACLKHPLAAAGVGRETFRARVRLLDRFVLRGPKPAPGLDGLRLRIARTADELSARGRKDDAVRIAALTDWLDGVAAKIAPLTEAMAVRRPVGDLLKAHIAAAEALAATDSEKGAERLWRGEEAEAASAFVADLNEAADGFPPVTGRRYPALLDALLAGRVVRPRFGRHPRLHIWGPLEARLQHADMMVLAGLNEGTWPPDAGHDPWMSRPMRARIGLPLPERRIGLAAHDFAGAFAAPEVVVSRSHRVGGAPTVPSRWLLRLANVLGEQRTNALKGKGDEWAARAREADRHLRPVAIARPSPTPPVALRPRRLSVTEIETWQVNPYAVYARHVLKLETLEALGADPGAAERGTFIHEVMEGLHRRYPKGVPAGGAAAFLDALLEIGRKVLDPIGVAPGLRAIWWPRFCDIARWVADKEAARRAAAQPLAAEKTGRQTFHLAGGDFVLTGRADRIDRLADGRLAIVDYKTGSLPAPRDQRAGFAPQLPLLAAMAELGAFDGVRPSEVAELAYWRLAGGELGGEEKAFVCEDDYTLAETIEDAKQGLIELVDTFDRADTPYAAYTSPQRVRFDDYRHLARVAEWSTEGDAS